MSESNVNTPEVKAEVVEEEFQFVGATEGEASEKISWNQNAQAIIIRNKMTGGLSSLASYEAGAAEYNALLSAGEITDGGDLTPLPEKLPKSYTNKNAGSVLYGMKGRFLKRCNVKTARDHDVTLAAAKRFGVIKPKAPKVEEPTPESEPVITDELDDALAVNAIEAAELEEASFEAELAAEEGELEESIDERNED